MQDCYFITVPFWGQHAVICSDLPLPEGLSLRDEGTLECLALIC